MTRAVSVALLTWWTLAGIAGGAVQHERDDERGRRRNVWPMAGRDLSNTRHQPNERRIGPDSAAQLATKWVFRTGGSVSATPAVDERSLYVPDWAGNLYRIDRRTGRAIWSRDVSQMTGVRPNLVRTTPAIHDGKLYFGDQGGTFRRRARVMAVEKRTGELVWMTEVDEHPSAIVTQGAVVADGRVYVGVSSLEETHAAVLPGYRCCTFRGSMLALDAATGEILWRRSTVPEDPEFTGNAIWSSTPVVDAERGSLYVTTGNNYTVPRSVADCVEAARAADPEDEATVRTCIDAHPGNYFDAVLALDLETGAVKWARSMVPFDAWTVSCIFGLINEENCPSPSGPDHDFGQGPSLFTVDDGTGGRRELLGAGQKSGMYFALDPATGETVWETRVGPAGEQGGLLWGSATDGERIYVANVNSEREWVRLSPRAPGSRFFSNGGVWSALDTRTGEILWQNAEPHRVDTKGPLAVANGVVFAGSMDPRSDRPTMFAMSAETGEVLWSFASGGSVHSAPAIVDGVLYWGSGYPRFKLGAPNDALYAFEVAER